MNKIKLFCIPYAGGSAHVYKSWKKYLDDRIELFPVELAGHGIRMDEELYQDIDAAVEDTLRTIRPHLSNGPYALFGHSLGSRIAYELLHRIVIEGLPEPVHVFFSGRGAPHMLHERKVILHQLDDDAFKQAIIGFGGTPANFFDHPELVEVFLPVLRNDFRLSEIFVPDEPIRAFQRDITILTGNTDEHVSGDIAEWEKHTTAHCRIYPFDGGHFFLHSQEVAVTSFLNMVMVENYWPDATFFSNILTS